MSAAPHDAAPVSLETTPVIPGFHPDPSVCRVGARYYLANSSFEYSPGVPIFTSTDMIRWELCGNALQRPAQFPAGQRGPSRGIFAPTLRHHDGVFWLITTDVGAAPESHLLYTAEEAAGPWSDPVRIPVSGIDPDIAWARDGRCFITWCAVEGGTSCILQAQVDTTSGRILKAPRRLWSGTGLAFPEGPHLFQRGAWWYLLVAEGGTERGHTVAVARARDIEGPYAGNPHNPILTHRSSHHLVQNTGHADLVETDGGQWAMVYLGVRARGTSPMFHANGRETFLAGVTWDDSWPVVDTSHYSGQTSSTAFTDVFPPGDLHPRWVSAGAHPRDFCEIREGGVVVQPHPSASGATSALSVRTADPHWRVEVDLVLGDGACDVGLSLDDRHRCTIRIDGGSASARLRIGELDCEIGTRSHGPPGAVTAVVQSLPPRTGGPDDIELSVIRDGRSDCLARFDGRYLTTEVAGGFTGRVLGVSARAGKTLIQRFSYTPEPLDHTGPC